MLDKFYLIIFSLWFSNDCNFSHFCNCSLSFISSISNLAQLSTHLSIESHISHLLMPERKIVAFRCKFSNNFLLIYSLCKNTLDCCRCCYSLPLGIFWFHSFSFLALFLVSPFRRCFLYWINVKNISKVWAWQEKYYIDDGRRVFCHVASVITWYNSERQTREIFFHILFQVFTACAQSRLDC